MLGGGTTNDRIDLPDPVTLLGKLPLELEGARPLCVCRAGAFVTFRSQLRELG